MLAVAAHLAVIARVLGGFSALPVAGPVTPTGSCSTARALTGDGNVYRLRDCEIHEQDANSSGGPHAVIIAHATA